MACVLPSTAELLAAATLAYHKLATGTKAVTVRDSNGESITYNLASQGNLKAYIQELTDAVAMAEMPGVNPAYVPGVWPRASQPMKFWM
jgi:hypothetical protein